MQKYLKLFFVLFIIVPNGSLSLNSNVDKNNIQETIAENEALLYKLELEIEQEEKQLNIDKAKHDYKNVVSNLENKFKECDAQTKDQADNTLSNILHEIKNIQSNAQDNESKLKEKDEIIANLTNQLAIQSKTLNFKINQLTEAETAELKTQIQNKDIEIQNLKSNNANADLKLKEYECQINSLESNISSYKSSIDKKNEEISNLELSVKQSKLQPTESKDLNISINQLQSKLSICNGQLTSTQQEKTKLSSLLQVKDRKINEMENQLNLCQTCKSDLNKLKSESAQKDARIESLRKNDEYTQKRLEQCLFENTNCKKKIEDKDKASQDDNDRKLIEGRLSVCQNSLNEVSKQIRAKDQDIFDAISNLSRCNEVRTAIQHQLDTVSNELKECRDSESARQRSLPNTCLSSTVGTQEIELDRYEPFQVPCEYGWMIIQRRLGRNVNFNESWSAYETGFGDWQGELFLGLEKLHLITNSRPYELKIRIITNWNQEYTAEYDHFRIGNSLSDYKLESLGKFKGNLHDSMRGNENMKFSTYDKNFSNCAKNQLGGWWFTAHCGQSNLNAQYKYSMRWLFKNGKSLSNSYFKFVYMMIRPKTAEK